MSYFLIEEERTDFHPYALLLFPCILSFHVRLTAYSSVPPVSFFLEVFEYTFNLFIHPLLTSSLFVNHYLIELRLKFHPYSILLILIHLCGQPFHSSQIIHRYEISFDEGTRMSLILLQIHIDGQGSISPCSWTFCMLLL